MFILNVVLVFLLQAPAQTIVVGLVDGQQLVLENPDFSGFIETRAGDAVLMYRQEKFQGEMSLRSVSRIDFGVYKKDKPFPVTVTLRNGQKIEVQTRRDFVMLKGKTDLGTVTIKHPNPLSTTLKLSTRKQNRQRDLTIQFLEIR
jgi:hypothetical protein